MGEHMWGCTRRKLSLTKSRRIDKLATKHGATFQTVRESDGRELSWFSCINRGDPHNKDVEEAVWTELEKAGLADQDGIIQ